MAFTYFFRDKFCLDIAIDFLVNNKINNQEIIVWDAGCANGPEPFTAAILFFKN